MVYCEAKAEAEGFQFERFSLANMRPKAVTTPKDCGEVNIKDATGHASERMVDKHYDIRKIHRSKATE